MDAYRILNGRIYRNGKFQTGELYLENGRISETPPSRCEIIDAEELWVLPGFIDIHTHGAAGVDFNNASVEDLKKTSSFFASVGTTAYLPTILTDSEENTLRSIKAVAEYIDIADNADMIPGAKILGIHLEGPFLSKEFKGAMPERFLKKPDFEYFKKLYECSGGRIKLITISPELNGAPELVSSISGIGVAVSLGHSGASYEETMECIAKGAISSTHTFNAMRPLDRHYPAILGAVLESDVYCEGIFDGKHLAPGIVRLLLKTKGTDRVIAVTDSIMAAGMPDGHYRLGANNIVVKDGDARLADGSARAGSTLTMNMALRNLVSFTKYPIESLVPLLTENPARLLKVYNRKGSLDPGKDGDIVIMDEKCDVVYTFVEGRLAYSRL